LFRLSEENLKNASKRKHKEEKREKNLEEGDFRTLSPSRKSHKEGRQGKKKRVS